MEDWANIYARELRETPPADEFLAIYFEANFGWERPFTDEDAPVGDDEPAPMLPEFEP